MLVVLAVQAHAPFACERLAAWFNAPLDDPDRTQTLLHYLRPFLNLVGGRGQQAAFDLLTTATDATTSAWRVVVAAPDTASTTPDEPSMAKAATAAKIAHHIGQQFFFASGAFDGRSGTDRQPAPRGEPATFASHAIPILRAMGAIQHAQVTQPVVETLIHLHPVNPRAVLLALAEAIPERSRYVTDPLAGGVVMPYLTRLLAEHRDLVLGDQEGISAFRRLLQALADAGHAEALAMAYTFSDVFR